MSAVGEAFLWPDLPVQDWRCLVTGSRNWEDADAVRGQLDLFRDNTVGRMTLVHGACPAGVDAMAAEWASWNRKEVTEERHPAQWDVYGVSAGRRRSAEMAAKGALICAAWVAQCDKERCADEPPHGSHGATHCVEEAWKRGIPIMIRHTGWPGADDEYGKYMSVNPSLRGERA